MWDWLQANYSLAALWSAWGAVVLGYVGFHFMERLLPAYRNPRVRELAADVRANLVFFFLNPVALLLGGFLSGEIARHLGDPRMRVDLS